MLTLVSVVGVRPNYIKLLPVVREVERRADQVRHVIIDTRQHGDSAMASNLFAELGIPKPEIIHQTPEGSPASRLAAMISTISSDLDRIRPDWALVYGDVLTTAAGAIAAASSGTRLAHYGSGVRSRDRGMIEERLRLMIDAVSDLHLVTHETCREQLKREGAEPSSIADVGNLLADAIRLVCPTKREQEHSRKPQALLTLHRPETVDQRARLAEVMLTIAEACADMKVLFPIHPRTAGVLDQHPEILDHWRGRLQDAEILPPLGYTELIGALSAADLVLTDSAGLREEAFILGKPCVTLRDHTEWPERLSFNTSVACGYEPQAIRHAITRMRSNPPPDACPENWDGNAAKRVIEAIVNRAAASA